VLKIQSGGWSTVLQRYFTQKNISVQGINISLRVIELQKKKGSYSSVLESFEGKALCLKFNLEDGQQFYREISPRKIYQSGALTSCSG
jgi:hypothetical protein